MKTYILAFLIFLMGSLGCKKSDNNDAALSKSMASPTNSPVSPSGLYRLEVTSGRDEANYWKFSIIKTSDGKPEFDSQNPFYTRFTNYIVWGSGDVVWGYNGDTGTYYWTKDPKGIWERHHYVSGQSPPPPEILHQLMPQRFPGEK